MTARRLFLTLLIPAFLAAASMLGPRPSSAQADNQAQAKELQAQAMTIVEKSLDEKSLLAAIALLESAAKLDPANEQVWIQIAWRYWMLGDDKPKESREEKAERLALFEQGRAAGEKAMALNERSVGGLYWYTVNLASGAEMKGILSSLSLAGTLFGNMSRVDRRDPYYLYGATRRFGSEVFVRVPTWLTEQFGFKPEFIEEDLLLNIEKWPNYFDNYVYLARVYVWAGKKDKAIEMLEFVLSHSPDVMPEERAENERQQKQARRMWKEYTGQEYPQK